MRTKAMVTVALMATVALSACGASSDPYYQPAAWGAPGYCYYVQSPYECYGRHLGTPAVMPLWWHERYAAYYDSPAYYDTYVPRRLRSVYVTRTRTFERTYSSAIKTASRSATYKGSNGKTVSGTKLGRSAVFGGGSARSTGFSGGSLRQSHSSPCAAVHFKDYNHALLAGSFSGGGARSGGISSGGGSRSSGGSARSGSPSSTRRSSPSGSSRNC